jgi:hypothetical protein
LTAFKSVLYREFLTKRSDMKEIARPQNGTSRIQSVSLNFDMLFVIRYSLFVIRYSLFVIRYSSFVIRHSSFVIRHSSFVIRYSLFVIRYSLYSLFIIRDSAQVIRRSQSIFFFKFHLPLHCFQQVFL